MPIPKQKPKEDKKNFISRCMSDDVMQEYDQKQRLAICMNQLKAEDVFDNIVNNAISNELSNKEWDEDWCEFIEDVVIVIAEEKKKVKLNKPFRTPDGPKKFAVYVKNDKGNIVLVRFGDPNMEIKRDDPERRKSFRSRHNCDNPGPKYKARYWSCKMWSNKTVKKIAGEKCGCDQNSPSK